MVEPPGELWRIGVLEVDDDGFVAVKSIAFPGLRGAMGHAGEAKIGVAVKAFAIKTIEERSRGGAVEAAVVKTEPYTGHDERGAPFYPFRCGKSARTKLLTMAAGQKKGKQKGGGGKAVSSENFIRCRARAAWGG